MGKLHHCIYTYSIPHFSPHFNSFFELGGSFCRFLSSYPDGVEDQIRICHTNTVTSEHYLFSVSGGVLANFYLHTPMVKKIRFKSTVPIQRHLNIIFLSFFGSKVRLYTAHRYHAILPWHKKLQPSVISGAVRGGFKKFFADAAYHACLYYRFIHRFIFFLFE